MFVLQTIPKGKGCVFPGGQGKPWKFTHISNGPTKFFLILGSLMFLFTLRVRLHLFFSWFRLSITIHLTPAMAGGIHRTMLQPRHSPEQRYCCTLPPLCFCTPVPSASCSWLESSRNQRESAVQAPTTLTEPMNMDINKWWMSHLFSLISRPNITVQHN